MAKKMSLFAKIMHAADYLADGILHILATNNEKEVDKQVKTNNKANQETGLIEKLSKRYFKVLIALDKHTAAKQSLTAQTAQLQQQTAAIKESVGKIE